MPYVATDASVRAVNAKHYLQTSCMQECVLAHEGGPVPRLQVGSVANGHTLTLGRSARIALPREARSLSFSASPVCMQAAMLSVEHAARSNQE